LAQANGTREKPPTHRRVTAADQPIDHEPDGHKKPNQSEPAFQHHAAKETTTQDARAIGQVSNVPVPAPVDRSIN